jgi:DNA primase
MSSTNDWEDAKERVRDRIDFVGLVEEYVNLEERGKGYWGLCPFHTEDTPSFSVTPSMGIFKCFGCGEGGDVFDFYMEIENCDFKEALRRLAERVDVDLPSGTDEETSNRRSRLREISNYAAKCFRGAFWGDPGKQAREYMSDRGYDRETLEAFDVGYAPDGWQNLIKALKRDGYDLEEARDVGLIRTSDNGRPYDAFRNRIMFPIRDLSGDVVAFGGRILNGDDDTPKYVNSTDSPIFHKRQILYGFPKARNSIRESGRCLLVEGYTDVMKCHQEGFSSAVATLGTALTEQHVQQVKRNTNELVLVYDGDVSGRQAARDGGEIAIQQGLDVSVLLMPEDEDPADVLSDSPESFRERLADRQSFMTFLFDWMVEEHSLEDAGSKETILKEFYPVLTAIDSEVEREETLGWLAEELGLREEVARNTLRKFHDQNRSSSSRPESDEEQTSESMKRQTGELIEEIFFRSLVHHSENFEEAMTVLVPSDFVSETHQDLLRSLKELAESERGFSGENWMEFVDDRHSSYLAGLLSHNEESRLAEGTDPVEIANKIKTLDSAKRERAALLRELAEQDSESDPGTLDDAKKGLLKEVMNLKTREGSVGSESESET